MLCELKRSPGIYLTGFMGSGKTTVARALAERLGWEFVDVDAEIEAREGSSIAEIFDTRGEEEFRRIETEVIQLWVRKVQCGMPYVIALGGGAFAQPQNLTLIEHAGVSIWLDCPVEVVEQRIASDGAIRPLARDNAAFRWLYDQRREAYSKAGYQIDAACDVDVAIERILELPFWK
ncbi:MAG TPA: shikimate kinase [Bryobacteraceae bacterium]|nr:shikimate kinase [Bryobacteraceae bacterium]